MYRNADARCKACVPIRPMGHIDIDTDSRKDGKRRRDAKAQDASRRRKGRLCISVAQKTQGCTRRASTPPHPHGCTLAHKETPTPQETPALQNPPRKLPSPRTEKGEKKTMASGRITPEKGMRARGRERSVARCRRAGRGAGSVGVVS